MRYNPDRDEEWDTAGMEGLAPEEDASCPCGKMMLTTGDPCPFCGGYPGEDEADGLDYGPPPVEPPGGYRCCVCGVNWVDAADGRDTCSECLAKQ